MARQNRFEIDMLNGPLMPKLVSFSVPLMLSTALQLLSERGALVLDCDAVYHELLRDRQELLDELSAAFPGTVIDGALDRSALAKIVFSDGHALAALNRVRLLGFPDSRVVRFMDGKEADIAKNIVNQ